MDDLKEYMEEEPEIQSSDLSFNSVSHPGLSSVLFRRESGFTLGGACARISSAAGSYKSADIIAENRLIQRDLQVVPCKLPSPSTRSAFLMVFSPDNSLVASTHGDHKLYIVRVKDGVCVRTLEGHPRTPWTATFHPSQNGVLASGCLGGQVRVWDLAGGSEVWKTECVVSSLTFHPKDRLLIIATLNELYFWDWRQSVPFTKISTQFEKEKILFVKFDAMGHQLVTGIANLKITQVSTRGASAEDELRGGDDGLVTPPMRVGPSSTLYTRVVRRPPVPPPSSSSNPPSTSASQTLSDLAAAASSQLEAENAAASDRPWFHLEPAGVHPLSLRRTSRLFSFNHSPESSFVQVSAPEITNRADAIYSSSAVTSDRVRDQRLRDLLSRRQSLHSHIEDLRSARALLYSTTARLSEEASRRLRIDEWAVNRRLSLARAEEQSPLPSEDPVPSGSGTSSDDRSNSNNPSINRTDIMLLGSHIEHMERLCQTSLRYLSLPRQRRHIVRLQGIRRMLEDLQGQIRSLREAAPLSASDDVSLNQQLLLTSQGLNRAMRRLNRSSSSNSSSNSSFRSPPSVTSRGENIGRFSRGLVSRLRANFRANEMSPDLSHSRQNNSVNEILVEESRAVMERTEATGRSQALRSRSTNDRARNDLRSLFQRLEEVIRRNRENNMSATSSTSTADSPRANRENADEEEEDDDDIFQSAQNEEVESEEREENTSSSLPWNSHLLDHGGYARQFNQSSSESESEPDTEFARSRRRDRNEDDEDDDSTLYQYAPSSAVGISRRVNSGIREYGSRSLMRERIDIRARIRRDQERIRQRQSRERDMFGRRRDWHIEEQRAPSSLSRAVPSSLRIPSESREPNPLRELVWRRIRRRNLQQMNALDEELDLDPEERTRHRELLSWMVDQLSIDQHYRYDDNEPPLPPPPPPAPQAAPGFNRRYATYRFFSNDEPHHLHRDNYFQHLRKKQLTVTHRLQVWDFSKGQIPNLLERTKNVVVKEAKIYNDASVDISSDGNTLVTLCSSNTPMTTMVGIYGTRGSSMGVCYATYSLESSAVSVSLSPTNRHLLVGLTTRSERVSIFPIDRSLIAQVFKIQYPWERISEKGRLIHHRGIHYSSDHHYIVLNCIRWIPSPGQGIIYATNTGLLQILR